MVNRYFGWTAANAIVLGSVQLILCVPLPDYAHLVVFSVLFGLAQAALLRPQVSWRLWTIVTAFAAMAAMTVIVTWVVAYGIAGFPLFVAIIGPPSHCSFNGPATASAVAAGLITAFAYVRYRSALERSMRPPVGTA